MSLTKTQKSLYDKIASGSQLQSETEFDFSPERKPLSDDTFSTPDLQSFAESQQQQIIGENKVSAWNALGAFAYQAVDTGSLGLAGVLADLIQPGTEEYIKEEVLDLESPEARLAGMAGSVLGYVQGAPLKLARGVAGKTVLPLVSKAFGKSSESAVLKEFTKAGKKAGIDKKTINLLKKDISGTIARNANNAELTAKTFRKSLSREVDLQIKALRATGKLKSAEAKALRDMTKKVAEKGVPVQDMLQLGKQLYGNTAKGRIVGQALNDVFVFSFIDAAMEGVYQGKEMWRGKQQEFNWANFSIAVGAGALTGVGLSSIEYLKPLGKIADSRRDFLDGMKTIFKRNPYKKMTRTELAERLRFMGEMRSRNGKSTEVVIGGKTYDLLKHPHDAKMGAKSLREEIQNDFKGGYKSKVRGYLNKEKNQFGRDLMKWATKESWNSTVKALPRMFLGGAVFNAAHWAQMNVMGAQYGVDWDNYDLLGNMMIGAYTQRKANPAKWDLGKDINVVRDGLNTLGFDVKNFHYSSSFDSPNNRFGNALVRDNAELKDYLIENRFASDDDSGINNDALPEGEMSVQAAMAQGEKFPMLPKILKMVDETFNHSKGLDEIGATEARRLIENFKKLTEIETVNDFEEKYNQEIMDNTASFEAQLTSIVGNLVNKSFPDLATKLTTRSLNNEPDKYIVPQIIKISKELKEKARNGELDYLGDLSGAEAVKELQNMLDSYEMIQRGSVVLGDSAFNQAEKQATIRNEETLSYLYNSIRSSEKAVNELFKQKDSISREFRYSDYGDYLPSVMANKALSTSKRVINIFSEDYTKKDEVSTSLIDAGLLTDDGKLIEGVEKIDLDGFTDADKADIRRKLQKVLAIQTAVGGYEVSKSSTKTTPDDVRALEEFLKVEGFDLNKIGDWFHQKVIQVINTDKWKNTNIQPSEAEFVMTQTNGTYGKAEFNVKTGKNNFILRKITSPEDPTFAAKYNRFIETIADKSKGLILVEDSYINIHSKEAAQLDLIIRNAQSNRNTNEENIVLSELFEAMENNGLTNVRSKMHSYIQQYGQQAQIQIMTWLHNAGIVTTNKNYDLKIDAEKVAYEYFEKVDNILSRRGYDDNYVDREYERQANLSKGRFVGDAEDVVKNPSISMQQLFSKYLFLEPEMRSPFSDDYVPQYQSYKEHGAEAQKEIFDELVKHDFDPLAEDQYFRADAIKRLMNRAAIERNNEIIPLKDLGRRKQKEIVEDITQIVFARRNIVTGKEMRIHSDGLRVEDKPYYMQKNEITNLFKEMDVELIIFNTEVLARGFNPFTNKHETRLYNLDDSSQNIPEWLQKTISAQEEKVRKQLGNYGFDSLGNLKNIQRVEDLDDRIAEGFPGAYSVPDTGLLKMRMYDGMDSIIVKASDRAKIADTFMAFYEKHVAPENITNKNHKKILDDLNAEFKKASEDETPSSNENYELALRYLLLEKMVGSNTNKKLYDTINESDTEKVAKILKRVKLVGTKNFVRPSKEYLYSVITARRQIDKKDKASEELLKRIKKDAYTVSIWNDEGSALLRNEMKDVIKNYQEKYPQIRNWSFRNVMGNAHKKATAFDSISFISKEMMMESHAIMGHNPNSKNPIKPVISSSGEGKELLLGKTLFVYEPKLDEFFRNNKIDVLLTKSGAKVFEEVSSDVDKIDTSILNDTKWNDLPNVSLNAGQKRNISLESIGFKPEKDASVTTAKESPSDANLFNNAESGLKLAEMQGDLDFALEQMRKILTSPISMRQFMIDEIGDGELPTDNSSMSISTINNMLFYLTHPDANPMSYSDRMVKNKLYSAFINNIMNNTRSFTNRTDDNGENKRYGGQAPLIQSLSAFNDNESSRLLPTLVDERGNLLMRGEIALPHHERKSTLDKLEGRGVRIVDNEKVFTVDEFINDYISKIDDDIPQEELQRFRDVLSKSSLEDVFDILKQSGDEVGSKYQLGIISRRNPRTRPNDITLLGLAGFLDEGYGNSAMVNSMDIVNVYEGDYDADKIDYFFAHNDYFFDHIKRSQSFFVQAIDPSNLQMKGNFHFGLTADESTKAIEKMVGDSRSYMKAIGMVQKTPRELNYLDNLSNKNFLSTNRAAMEDFIREDDQGNVDGPGVLFKNAKKELITIDYRSLDFFMRSALEMQYIVDGSGQLNPEIAGDIFSWKDDFLFPEILKSVAPNEFTTRDAKEVVDNKGANNDGKRARIFQKLTYDKASKKYRESDLDLTNAEKAIIKEMISEYSALLQVTGKEHYADTGEGQRVDFDSFINQANTFIGFNKNLESGVWKNLTSKRALRGKDYEELKDIFGFDYNKKKKRVEFKNDLFEYIRGQGESISKGESGSYIDRMVVNIAKSDLFKNEDRAILDETMDAVDDWYVEMMSNSNVKDADAFGDDLVKQVLQVNKKIGTVKYLDKKIRQIGNSNASYKWKNEKIKRIKYVINKLKGEIRDNYGQYVPFKNQDLTKIEFVNLENDPDLKYATIYFNTINSLLKTEIIGASRYDDFKSSLDDKGRKDLKRLKKLRSGIYGDTSLINEIAQYGDKSVLTKRDIEILNSYNADDFYEWQMKYINSKVNEHGMEFLMAFMEPSRDKKKVGVYKNRAVSIPYVDVNRYKLGIRFLTDLVHGRRRTHDDLIDAGVYDEAQVQKIKENAPILLNILRSTEGHYTKFFRGDHMMRRQSEVNRERYGLASFDPYLERQIKSYEEFSWMRNNMPYNTTSIVNNSVLDFYKNMYQSLGKGQEFDKFLTELDNISVELSSNTLTNPYKYMGMRLQLDADFQKFISSGIDFMQSGEHGTDNIVKITEHPAFKLSRGFKFMEAKAGEEGLTLEKSSKVILDRIRQLSVLDANLIKAKESLMVRETSQELFNEMKQGLDC